MESVQSELEVEWVATADLFGNPANPRHNDEAVGPVADSIRRFGWQQPVVAKPSGEVIAGNTRLKAAQRLGLERVPVVRFTGSDIDATAYSIADNRTHDFASFDEVALAKLLEALRAEDALEGVGYTPEQVDALIAAALAEERSDLQDPGPGEPPEFPVTRPGDLWILGDHKLLCGDSTNAAEMARLMAGETAMLLASDSPYLVDYDGTNHPADHHRKAGRKDPPGGEVGNKHWDEYVDPETSLAFFSEFLRVALAHCSDRVPVYQWHATRRQKLMEEAWEQNGLLVHQTIIWSKTRGVLTRSHFLWKHEPCFYGWRKGMQPEKDRRPPPSETTIWEIEQKDAAGIEHPTVKPLPIFEKPISWHTKPGEIVLEPFSGSATQIVCAEKLARRCRAMELSPAFCDVGIRRWEEASGKRAVLDGDGRAFSEVAAERLADIAVETTAEA